jgi:hypothetical protein
VGDDEFQQWLDYYKSIDIEYLTFDDLKQCCNFEEIGEDGKSAPSSEILPGIEEHPSDIYSTT